MNTHFGIYILFGLWGWAGWALWWRERRRTRAARQDAEGYRIAAIGFRGACDELMAAYRRGVWFALFCLVVVAAVQLWRRWRERGRK